MDEERLPVFKGRAGPSRQLSSAPHQQEKPQGLKQRAES